MGTAALNGALVRRLQQLDQSREYLRRLDEAVALLSPADKLIYHKLILHPEMGNADRLCQLLELEERALYYRRQKLLQRLSPLLPPP